MADYNFVTARVATGGAISMPDDANSLIAAGINAVIDCREEFDDGLIPPEWFAPGIAFALNALAKPHTRVYAHCAAGVNRGPSMCMAILLAQGLDAATAENLIRTHRPQVNIAYKHAAIAAVSALGYV